MPESRKPLTIVLRRLRRDATDAEKRLWRSLRREPFEAFHFRGQVPLGRFVADFASHSARLVIELDGGQHGAAQAFSRDADRTCELERAGYRVVRFWNTDVFERLEGVLDTISSALYDARLQTGDGAAVTPAPDPSPQGGGGKRP